MDSLDWDVMLSAEQYWQYVNGSSAFIFPWKNKSSKGKLRNGMKKGMKTAVNSGNINCQTLNLLFWDFKYAIRIYENNKFAAIIKNLFI